MPETALQQQTVRQRNWMPWLGLLLAVMLVFSNLLFLVVPAPRAILWLTVALGIAALACAAVGIMRVYRQPQVYRGKVSSLILGVLSLLICGLFAFASLRSRELPASAAAPQVGQKAPDFTLADTSGNKVSLGQLLGKADSSTVASANNSAGQAIPASLSTATPTKAVLLIFYRGYW